MVSPLRSIAGAQLQYPLVFVGLAIVLTGVLGLGIPQIQLQTDFQASLPDDLPPIAAQDRVEAQFGTQDAIIILIEIDDRPKEPTDVTDMRNPALIGNLRFLQGELEREPLVDSVSGLPALFRSDPGSKQEVKQILAQAGTPDVMNRDYTATTLFVTMSEPATEDNIRRAADMIDAAIEDTPWQPGIDVRVTGTPVVRTDISDILVSDTARTIAIASAFILALLFIARGRAYGPITFIPLFVGLVWTLGVMGWAGIPLTVATISMGSMILGLGVEYGSFITERIMEEREEQGSLEDAILTAVPNTGKAVLGSSATDGVGFLALLLASISFVRDLGISLALGEFLTVTAAVSLTPAFIITHDRWFDR